jgi:hypothetical protein
MEGIVTTTGCERRVAFVSAVFLVAALAVACGLVSTPIGDILAKPAEFEGKDVTVSGTASGVVKLPFLPGFYSLKDSSGEIVVLTEGKVPTEGSSVRIRAKVESAATVGGRAFGTHLREIAGK